MSRFFISIFPLFKYSLAQICITSSTAAPTVPPTCPSGWTQFQSACYIYQNTYVTTVMAMKNCEALGGHLASIHSAAEMTFVQNLAGPTTLIWIGMIRIGTVDNDANFANVDGTPVDYSHWNLGEPNMVFGSAEFCVHVGTTLTLIDMILDSS